MARLCATLGRSVTKWCGLETGLEGNGEKNVGAGLLANAV